MLFSKKLMCRALRGPPPPPKAPCSSSSSIIADLPCSEYASQSGRNDAPLDATSLSLLLLLLLLLRSPIFLVALNEDDDDEEDEEEEEEFGPLRRLPPEECP